MPLPNYWFRLITKDLEAIEMKGPTEQQLRDPKWWDENAPEGTTHFFPPSGDWYKNAEHGLECRSRETATVLQRQLQRLPV